MIMDSFFINSINVRGLGNSAKCKSMLGWLSRIGGIYFLQETYSDEYSEKKWKSSWKGDIYFAHGNSNSKGVAILIHDNLQVEVLEKIADKEGRFIALKVRINEETLLLCNCYFPTKNHQKEQIRVLEELTNMLIDYSDIPLIVGGDFNVVIDPELEKSNYKNTDSDSKKFRISLLSFLETFNLEDVIRNIAPKKKIYTWHNKNISTRLDYLFMSQQLTNHVCDYTIQTAPYTDHDLVKVKLKTLQSVPKGHGTWKLNVSLLSNNDFVKQIKSTIANSYDEVKNYEDKGFILDYIKMKVRSESIRLSKKIKSEEKKLENLYATELIRLNKNLSNCHSSETLEEIEIAKRELEKIQTLKTNGAIVRSKMVKLEDGEKNSSYFLSLEKQKQKTKVISQLQIGNDTTQDHEKIMDELHSFYSNLYKDNIPSPDNQALNNFFKNDIPKLSKEDQTLCEGVISEQECTNALKQMANNKTPGLDGFPVEFYKLFWLDLKVILINSYNYSYEKGELSIDQKRGVITLIPKKDKNRLLIKNWRPITLLPVDYKILAKVLANRLKKVIHKIVNRDQTGYIKGRYIGENIRMIKDVISYLNIKDKSGLLCLIDFEKAFDTIKWEFLKKSLQAFNFGPSLLKWVDILYKNSETSIINNGHQTNYFQPEKGVRQGCPLSAFLFILAVEILAIRIRNSENIKGLLIDELEVKISQLADDTTVFLRDTDSIKHLFDLLENFKLSSGLKANIDKTKFYSIGPKEIPNSHTANIVFEKTPIKLLGLTVTNDKNIDLEENFIPRINAIKNILKHWSRRKLSLKGKITIINSLALSQLIYPATNLEVPHTILVDLNKILYDFLWDGKRPKIAAQTIESTISEGGLKMPNLFLKVKSWQLSWLRRALLDPEAKWILIVNAIIDSTSFGYLAKSRTNLNQMTSTVPEFYKEILKTWYEIREHNNSGIVDVPTEALWHNMNITVENKEIFKRSWYGGGIKFIHNLLDNNGKFLSHYELGRKYNVNCTFLEALQIRMAIPLNWRKILNTESIEQDNYITEPKMYVAAQNKFKPFIEYSSKDLYWQLFVKNCNNHTPSCKAKWNETFPTHNLYWKSIYTNAFETCRSTKLQSFQYRVLNRTIACNHWLYNIKIKSNPNCDTCKIDDDLQHFFIECDRVKPFWTSFRKWYKRISKNSLDISHTDIILGKQNITPNDKCLNYLLIQAKKFINDNKLNEAQIISFYTYLHLIKNELSIEHSIAMKNGKLKQFDCTFGFVFDNL